MKILRAVVSTCGSKWVLKWVNFSMKLLTSCGKLYNMNKPIRKKAYCNVLMLEAIDII